LSQQTALGLQTSSIALMVALTPVAGWLADRFGVAPSVMAGIAACAVAAVPLLAILRDGDPTNDLFAELAFSVCIIATLPPYQVWLAERFPRDLRASGLGLAYNGAAGILGGITPLLCATAVELTGSTLAPGAYVALACAVSLLIAVRNAGNRRSGARVSSFTTELTAAHCQPRVGLPFFCSLLIGRLEMTDLVGSSLLECGTIGTRVT
jgi:MHS family proline/betaine transporter-like MFS transporter